MLGYCLNVFHLRRHYLWRTAIAALFHAINRSSCPLCESFTFTTEALCIKIYTFHWQPFPITRFYFFIFSGFWEKLEPEWCPMYFPRNHSMVNRVRFFLLPLQNRFWRSQHWHKIKLTLMVGCLTVCLTVCVIRHATSAFVFSSIVKKGFFSNKWWCLHLTCAFSRIRRKDQRKMQTQTLRVNVPLPSPHITDKVTYIFLISTFWSPSMWNSPSRISGRKTSMSISGTASRVVICNTNITSILSSFPWAVTLVYGAIIW